MRRLDNSAWGFSSSCFVCEPSNPRGLGIAYYHDEQDAVVRAEVCLGQEFSGAPRLVHGGVVYTVMDEAMAWAAIALAGRFALVGTSTVRFTAGVAVDATHRVTAGLSPGGTRVLRGWARLDDAGGRRCASAEAKLVVMSAEVAAAAIGDLDGSDGQYLNPRHDGVGSRDDGRDS